MTRARGHVPLDYTGERAVRQVAELLRSGLSGNPHSTNPTSAASTELLEHARTRVVDFFKASPDEYVAIFTPNATSGK